MPLDDDSSFALEAFLTATTWNETHAVLLREQQRLLHPDVDQALATRIAQAPTSEAAHFLEIHRHLLRRCQDVGVEPAWQEFRAALQPQVDPLEASLLAFVNMRPLAEQRRYLDTHPELLDPRSDAVLQDLLEQYHDQPRQHSYLAACLRLLQESRTIGIPAAWETYVTLRQTESGQETISAEVTELLQRFQEWIDQPTYRDERHYLEQHPELTRDAARALLAQVIATAQAQAEDASDSAKVEAQRQAHSLVERQRLLEDIHQRGGTIAAIRAAYVNWRGGFMLDLPPWLEESERQAEGLRQQGRRDETAAARAQLWRVAAERAVQDQTVAPETQAEIQARLWDALDDVTTTNRRETQEAGLKALKAASTVYTRNAYPRQWATTQNNLAITYRNRIAGNRRDNLEEAIAHYELALLVRTQQDFPIDWAQTQNNLANTYQQRIAGNRRDNLEEAIAHYKLALLVLTQQDFPVDWASTQNNLAITYQQRIAGNRRDNLEEAIAHYELALLVRTQQDFPVDWANTQNNLAITYQNRIAGNRRDNLEEAIAHYELALLVRTQQDFPLDHRDTQLNLAWVWLDGFGTAARERQDSAAEQAAYTHAHQAFLAARTVQAELGWLATDPQSRADLHGEHHSLRELYARDAWCLLQTGALHQAVVALEAGRAQALNEAQAVSGVALEGVCATHAYAFHQARTTLGQSRQAGGTMTPRDARDAFLQVRAAIRQHCQPDFLPDAPTYPEIARAADPHQALVYLAATDFGGFALVVPPAAGHPDPDHRQPLLVRLPHLTWQVIDDWLIRPDDDGRIVGGYQYALQHAGESLLLAWLQRAADETEQQRRLALPLADIPAAISPTWSTLRSALGGVIAAWRAEADTLSGEVAYQEQVRTLRARLQLPLGEVLAQRLLSADLGWFFQEAEIERLQHDLHAVIIGDLHASLRQLGLGDPDQAVALIPCGRLGVLPVHAGWVRPGVPFLDTCELTYQPSARTLAVARQTLAHLPTTGPIHAIGDPQPTRAAPLAYAEAEADAIDQLARQYGRAGELLVQQEATRSRLLALLAKVRQQQSGAWVQIATHGHANPADPEDCFLLLAGYDAQGRDEVLSLAELQRGGLLEGTRGFNASGCVTALGDFEKAPDELNSFASGLLQAGTPCAIATQWSVSDKATFLLMQRFMHEWLAHPDHAPAWALRQAIRWLRGASQTDLDAIAHLAHHDVTAALTRDAVRGVVRDTDVRETDARFAAQVALARLAVPPRPHVHSDHPYDHAIYYAAAIVFGV